MTQPIELRVTVLSLLFGPTEDGYRIVSAHDAKGERIVLGGKVMPDDIDEGDEVLVEGRWKQNERGPMLMVNSARKTLPQTEKGMAAWLARARIPGIGKVRAERLVAEFGLEALKKIVARDEGASKITGKKALEGAAVALEHRMREAEIGTMLSGYGIGGAVQNKITQKYGAGTQDMLTRRPYELITDIKGIAFGTADKIALSAGFAKDSPERIRAAIIEALRLASTNGHTALYHHGLVSSIEDMIYVSSDKIEEQIKNLSGKAIQEHEIRGNRTWSLTRLDDAEERVARNIINKLAQAPRHTREEAEQAVDAAISRSSGTLNERQREAAIVGISSPLSILTGGPGTGKTHTLRIILEAWKALCAQKRLNLPVQIAAPTGKAAKRASEVTGIDGKTIHRALEYDPESNSFQRNRGNPIDAGFLAIDESSMPDILITRDLTEAWGDSSVLLVGDVEQIPSVGPGCVLRDLLESGVVPATRLIEIYRQSEGSEVALGADDVRLGRMPQTAAPGKGELVFIDINSPAEVAERIREMYVEKMPRYLASKDMDPTSIQILSPGKQGDVGTLNLNKMVQESIHGPDPKGPQVMLSDKMVGRVGDRVIQLENDYELNIFNGDTGRIIEIETNSEGKVTDTHVDFGDRIVGFSGSALGNLTLAYALTIHKSQGSEFQVVIIPMTSTHYTLNKRPLIYTGMTRAKKICVFVGQRRALKNSLGREDAANRITTLASRLRIKCDR